MDHLGRMVQTGFVDMPRREVEVLEVHETDGYRKR